MLDCKGNGNRLLQRPSVPLQTAGKLDGVHVNLLTGTNIQRRSSAPLSAGEEEVLDPGSFVGFTETSTLVRKLLQFKEPLCCTPCKEIANQCSLSFSSGLIPVCFSAFCFLLIVTGFKAGVGSVLHKPFLLYLLKSSLHSSSNQ